MRNRNFGKFEPTFTESEMSYLARLVWMAESEDGKVMLFKYLSMSEDSSESGFYFGLADSGYMSETFNTKKDAIDGLRRLELVAPHLF